MRKITLFLFSAILGFTACNGSSEPKPIVKDSARENSADYYNSNYNPAKPVAPNSDDDPNRYPQ
ncbi:MAG: hypothetical protein ICV79_22990 [Flavisolibacter sp.]|nr:hypothetical protein [Flavisolibacter sp.]